MMSAPSTTVRRTALWFAIALLLQLAIIGGMVASQQVTAQRGTPIYLQVEPVDPRDPLRGDYMTFRYNISRIGYENFGSPSDGITPPRDQVAKSLERGETVWVPLYRSGKVWEVTFGVTTGAERPKTGDGGFYGSDTVFMRGSVESTGPSEVTVVYGIEEYFIPEGTGADWPRVGVPDATARVLVDPKTGKSVLTTIFLDGKPWP